MIYTYHVMPTLSNKNSNVKKYIRATAWNKIFGWNRKQVIKSICHYLNTQLFEWKDEWVVEWVVEWK